MIDNPAFFFHTRLTEKKMALKLVMVLALSAFAIGGKLSQEPRRVKIEKLSQPPPIWEPHKSELSSF